MSEKPVEFILRVLTLEDCESYLPSIVVLIQYRLKQDQ